MRHLMKPLADGILTGLFLQLAIGPVFFFILGITMDSNYINALSAIMAVTLADYIFIILSIIGTGRLLKKDKVKTVFGLLSSFILLLFGLAIFYKGVILFDTAGEMANISWTPVKSFTTCFILTISSPLTILFWGSIFSAKVFEKKYISNQLVLFGIGAGAATFAFLALTMLILSYFRAGIPNPAVQILNGIVGMILIYYGVSRTAAVLSEVFRGKRVS